MAAVKITALGVVTLTGCYASAGIGGAPRTISVHGSVGLSFSLGKATRGVRFGAGVSGAVAAKAAPPMGQVASETSKTAFPLSVHVHVPVRTGWPAEKLDIVRGWGVDADVNLPLGGWYWSPGPDNGAGDIETGMWRAFLGFGPQWQIGSDEYGGSLITVVAGPEVFFHRDPGAVDQSTLLATVHATVAFSPRQILENIDLED